MADEGRIEYLTEWPPQRIQEEEPSTEQKKRSLSFECELEKSTFKKAKRNLQCMKPVESLAQSEVILNSEENKLITRSPSVPITTILAQWWKFFMRSGNKSRNIEGYKGLSDLSNNPHTLLHHICKFPEVKHFLAARAEYLESLPPSSEVHHALSTTYHQLQQYDTALSHARLAMEEDPGNQEVVWHLELLKRQNNVVRKRDARHTALGSATDLKMPQAMQVDRKSVTDLSYEEFFTQYALTHTPVIITGVTYNMTTRPWTFEYIKQVIGHETAPLRRPVAGSVEWARLEPAGESTVSQFIDSLFHDHTNPNELKYLFDWSLPLHCPDLAAELTIPHYFAGDFLQRTPPGTLYRDSWPSLFVSPAGITSELHVDAFGSNFWMALFQGKKRWVFFPPEDTPLLYPTYTHSTDAVFEVNLSQPDFERHPLLSLTHPTECVLSPGELLYVPAGSPHRVENVEPSLAISANYVDQSNFEGVLAELRVNALRDERARALLHILEAPNFNSSVDYKQSALPWKTFKTWPR